MPLFCCSVFSFCWHSEHVGRRQRVSFFFFYRSHATSQWSMDAGPLQTYTVEHALCGSAKRGHLVGGGRGDASCLTPALNHLSSRLLSQPSRSSFLSHIPPTLPFNFSPLFPSLPYSDWKPLKDGVNQQKILSRWEVSVYAVLRRPVNGLGHGTFARWRFGHFLIWKYRFPKRVRQYN